MSGSGLITGLIFGVASLVIAIIIALVITSTLTSSNLVKDGSVATATVVNETLTPSGDGIATISVISSYPQFTSWNITLAINGSIGGAVDNVTLVEGTDYQVFSSNGSVGNITTNIDGFRTTYTWTQTDTSANNAVGNLTANFTSGIDNVSSKIPTVLLIAAIVLILSILAILVGVWQRMRLGGGSL